MLTLEERVDALEKRNRRVQAHKAWETSITRRLILILLTYSFMGFFLRTINVPNPWVNALTPTIGYFISTQSLPLFKNLWLKKIYMNK